MKPDLLKNENTLSSHSLLAANDVYWGLGIFAGILAACGYFFESGVLSKLFYGATAVLVGASMLDILFYQKRVTRFWDSQIEIIRGLVGRKEQISFDDIKTVELLGNNSSNLGQLKTFDIEKDNKLVKKLRLMVKPKSNSGKIIGEKEIEFNAYDYKDLQFLYFIKFFQQKHLEYFSTHTEKIQFSAQECDTLLQQDKKLIKDLTEAMQEAYKSVYETHIMYAQPEEKEFVREQMRDLAVIYSYTPDNKTYYYFVKDDYLPLAEAEDISTAHNLIETSQKNITLVENRIIAYKKVQEKLAKVLEQQLKKDNLKNLATKINNLQQNNIIKNSNQDDIHFDAEVFEQYNKMLLQIQQAETAEEAEFLKQYISEIEKLKE